MRRLVVFLLLCPIIRPAVINLNQLNLQQILQDHDLGEVDLNQLDLPQILKQINSRSGSAGEAIEGSAIGRINVVGGTRGMKYVCDVWCPKVKKLVKSGDQNVDYWVSLKGTKKTVSLPQLCSFFHVEIFHYNRDNFEEVCSICQKQKIRISD